jgi:Cu-processing system ATP-binding protein
MIEVRGLTKAFGKVKVLSGIDAAFAPARVTAVLGPNAAGKTTLLKTILGLTRADAGEILMNGVVIGADPSYRSAIGYMPQLANFPANLKGGELVDMLCSLRASTPDPDKSLIDAFGIADHLKKQLGTMSGGTRQKVNSVIAFMFRPDLLIMDEPTAGLDPVASGILKARIVEARNEGKTVLVTSHIISEVEEIADDVVFILDGKVRFGGSIASLKAGTRQHTLERAVAKLMMEVAA